MIKKYISKPLSLYWLCAALLVLQSCFTGIESTPRITASDVKRENITVTPEMTFLADVSPQSPAHWTVGKRFRAIDPRIALIFNSDAPIDTAALAHAELCFAGMRPLKSILGYDVVMIDFDAPDGQRLHYKTEVPYAAVDTLRSLEVPFAVDIDLVQQVDTMLSGHVYYITTPMWYAPDGSTQVGGLRHVPVHIDRVLPGNAMFPLLVVFTPDGDERSYSVFMTVGASRTATRNFDTLFAFGNPRLRYPRITDDTWQLIVHSQVKLGMTRDECRLALGAPTTRGQRPTTAGMVEYWSYADGVYLLFEEGLLSSYRR